MDQNVLTTSNVEFAQISASKIITDEIEAGTANIGLTLDGNITASNDISASGKISADKLQIQGKDAFDYITSPVTGLVVGNTAVDSLYRSSDKHQYLTGRVVVGGTDNFGGDKPKLNVDGTIATDSHITSSGIISASGGFIGDLTGTINGGFF